MAQLWPIGGGKGGSGKSFIAFSLGYLLAKAGKKTLLIDLDLGAANLHTMANIPYPPKCLSDFISSRTVPMSDIILPTSFPNLFLISGARDNLDIANLAYEKKMKIIRSIAKLNYDYIILDLGAGTSFNTLDFFLASRNGIFITTPEPTSIENVYRLVRAIYLRRIRHFLSSSDFKSLEKKAVDLLGHDTLHKPEHMISVVKNCFPEKYEPIKNDFKSFRFRLILNQLRRHHNVLLGEQVCKVIKKHLGIPVDFAGNIAYDEHVHDAIYQRANFLERYPHTQAANNLRQLDKKLRNVFGEQLTFQDL